MNLNGLHAIYGKAKNGNAKRESAATDDLAWLESILANMKGDNLSIRACADVAAEKKGRKS
jgi:hypothetical protein